MLQFDTFYFTDIAQFVFKIQVHPELDVPFLEQPVNGTTPYEAGANIIHRAGHVNASGEWHVSRVDHLSYKIIGYEQVGECLMYYR